VGKGPLLGAASFFRALESRERPAHLPAQDVGIAVPAEGFADAKPLTPVGRKRPANVLCPREEESRKRA
jgi:hypothetical protein